MLTCMFERQRVRIREVRRNLKMEFGREAHERQLLPRSFANVVRLSLHCRFPFHNLQIGHLVIEGPALKVSNLWMYRASREVGIDVRPGRRMTVQFSSHAGTKDRKIGTRKIDQDIWNVLPDVWDWGLIDSWHNLARQRKQNSCSETSRIRQGAFEAM